MINLEKERSIKTQTWSILGKGPKITTPAGNGPSGRAGPTSTELTSLGPARLTDWLIGWLIDWLIDWLCEWMNEWMNETLTALIFQRDYFWKTKAKTPTAPIFITKNIKSFWKGKLVLWEFPPPHPRKTTLKLKWEKIVLWELFLLLFVVVFPPENNSQVEMENK